MLSPLVTLKIRTESPKLNHFFLLAHDVSIFKSEFTLWFWRLSVFWSQITFKVFILISSSERKAHWLAYRIGRPPSSVCRPHSLNISETIGPIEVKFHMESPWDGGTKVYSNGPGHMTKMAAMPIYGKYLKKSSPEPKCRWPWNLVCSIGCSSTTKFIQMMTLDWPWTILRHGQIWSLMLLYGKKVKQWIFQKLLSSVIWY